MVDHLQAIHWAFTVNNPADYDLELEYANPVQYACWNFEIGENGTPHLQGYIMLWKKARGSVVKALLPYGTHLEVARNPTAARLYCQKADTAISPYFSVGTFPEQGPGSGQGKRSDLSRLHNELKNGLHQHDYIDRFFDLFVRYPNLVDRFRAGQIRPRDETSPHQCLLFLGKPGAGKSYYARRVCRELTGNPPYNRAPGKFWEGYTGQQGVLLDDFGGHHLSFTDFKLAVDRYPIRVEIKGTSCELATTYTFITSNKEVEQWYSQEILGIHGLSAITRRITGVYYFVDFLTFYQYPSYDAYAQEWLTPLRDGQERQLQAHVQKIQIED